MARIKILGDALINRIAAGEVIQRPASVVKELIENSIDAGAGHIEIRILRGGKDLVTVNDNGAGMDEEDLLLSIERHATSKVDENDEIFGATSLGFRGEALPAIASVSKMDIETCPGPDGPACRLETWAGTIRSVEPCVRPRGTTVRVKRLFFNTPARRKFLKSENSEAAHVREVVSASILTHPDIAFTYYCDDRRILASPGDGDITNAIARVFGSKDGRRMSVLKQRRHPSLPFSLSGALSTGLASRSSPGSIVLSVNGRVFKSPVINRVIQRVYAPFLAPNRWPVAVLFIEADPRIVDVNVHPAKLEVRFSFFPKLESFIRRAVADSIHSAAPRISGQELTGRPDLHKPQAPQAPAAPFQLQARQHQPATAAGQLSFPDFPAYSPRSKDLSLTRDGEPVIAGNTSFSVLGQVFDTYIVAVTPDFLVLIDQHAAHERVVYERVLEGTDTAHERVQRLLVRQRVELDPDELKLLREHCDEISRMGIEADFSDNAILFQALPSLFEKKDLHELAHDLIDGFREQNLDSNVEGDRAAVAAMAACKAAIKANHKLTVPEMNALLRSLFACSHPTRCPHGRPTIIEISPARLEKIFGRA